MPNFKAMKDDGKRTLTGDNFNLSKDFEVSKYIDTHNEIIYEVWDDRNQYRFARDGENFCEFRDLPSTIMLDVFNNSELKLILDLEAHDSQRIAEASDDTTINMRFRIIGGKISDSDSNKVYLPLNLEAIRFGGAIHTFTLAEPQRGNQFVNLNSFVEFAVHIRVDDSSSAIIQ